MITWFIGLFITWVDLYEAILWNVNVRVKADLGAGDREWRISRHLVMAAKRPTGLDDQLSV